MCYSFVILNKEEDDVKKHFAIFLLLVLIIFSFSCSAVQDSGHRQYKELKKQTELMQQQAIVLERIAVALEKIAEKQLPIEK